MEEKQQEKYSFDWNDWSQPIIWSELETGDEMDLATMQIGEGRAVVYECDPSLFDDTPPPPPGTDWHHTLFTKMDDLYKGNGNKVLTAKIVWGDRAELYEHRKFKAKYPDLVEKVRNNWKNANSLRSSWDRYGKP